MPPERRSSCPISCALDIFGDKWTLLLVRDMLLLGKERYDQFLGSPEGIATNVLADRLARLTELGIAEQRPDPRHRGRATYHLSKRGVELRQLLREMIKWGLKNVPRTKVPGDHKS